MKSIKTTLILLITSFFIVGCSSKIDIKTTNYIPEQAIGNNSNDYRTTMDIIKNSPHWTKDLENETLRFNMYVQDTFNEIENKKEYLRKTYNVQYYNFDEKGFNSNNSNAPIKPKQEIKNNNISSTIQKQNISSNVQEVKMREETTIEKNNSVNKSPQTIPTNKSYDNQIFNEYNF